MPAKAGIQGWLGAKHPAMDSRFRGNDEHTFPSFFNELLRRDIRTAPLYPAGAETIEGFRSN